MALMRTMAPICAGLILMLSVFLLILPASASGDGLSPSDGADDDRPIALPRSVWDGDHRQPAPGLIYNLHRDLITRMLRAQNQTSGIQEYIRTRLQPPELIREMPTGGNVTLLVILVDFPDAPALPNQTVAEITPKLFGAGDPRDAPYESLRAYYQRSSYGQLLLDGDVHGWYHSSHTRDYYRDLAVSYQEQLGNEYGPFIGQQCARSILLRDAVTALDDQIDFGRYDADGNGVVDGIVLKFAGENEGDAWRELFWGCQDVYVWDILGEDLVLDGGMHLGGYIFTPYAESESYGDRFYHPATDIHETGHLLGLPDYYDYDPATGPGGGVGGWDMMDAKWGDHNAFSKYLLGWLTPTLVNSDGRVLDLQPATSSHNAVIVMPGATLDSYAEFFMVECRGPGQGNDPLLVTDYEDGAFVDWVRFPPSLFIWHVDARLDNDGEQFVYDNADTSHKLLRLMEADGAEHLETDPDAMWDSYWDVADLYRAGDVFGPETSPDSRSYNNTPTGVTVSGIISSGDGFRAWIGTVASPPVTTVPTLTVTPTPTSPPVLTIPGGSGVPGDFDENGVYEDVNGNGRKDFADVVLFFNQMTWIPANEPVSAFDYNGNGRIDFADVVWLFNNL